MDSNRDFISEAYDEAAEKYGRQRLAKEMRSIYKETENMNLNFEDALSIAVQRLSNEKESKKLNRMECRGALVMATFLTYCMFVIGLLSETQGGSHVSYFQYILAIPFSALVTPFLVLAFAPILRFSPYEVFKYTFSRKKKGED